ncbi:hypothetical protein SPD48_11505 [Pseudogracilibacillus sp. SE30717A]|uniref:hypothetical protein n=1 Tax=Pseudogracilibacillus sp. SE30717A TaxID=3098293 RepID=UPI00300E195E
MGDRAKLLRIGMWALVIFSILLFVVIIMIGHSNSFNFSQPDVNELVFNDTLTNDLNNLKHL